MQKNLMTLSQNFKNNNSDENTIELFKYLNPIIKKYSLKLGYECAETDLKIFLIELFSKIKVNDFNEFSLLAYVKKSIYHEYCRLLKQNKIKYKDEFCCDEVCILKDIDQVKNCELLMDDKICFKLLISEMHPLEQQILQMIFFEDLKESQIAKSMNVSRQYINKIKRKALKNLRYKLEAV